MIAIDHLRHVYPGTRRQPERVAIHDLSFAVAEGEFCILSGPNGSGKSSLFRILCGMMQPTAGTVTVGGFSLATQMADVRRVLGVVFQSPAVDKHLSVLENLTLHGRLYGLKGAEAQQRIEASLAWSDLQNRLGDKVDTLSGGLARQVELAKVLMTHPKVLLLDEPTTGLDPASRRSFLLALKRLQREQGMTVLMTSHIFSEAEDVDRVAIMSQGHLLACDRPAALTAHVGREMVVVRTSDPTDLAAAIVRELSSTDQPLQPIIYGDEVRLENIETGAGASRAVELIDGILRRWPQQVQSVAVKHPTLDDVFVHFTGKMDKAA